jgi:hypothetical protein
MLTRLLFYIYHNKAEESRGIVARWICPIWATFAGLTECGYRDFGKELRFWNVSSMQFKSPFSKAVRGRFLRQKQEANAANANYCCNSPLLKATPLNSPLKKGDKGGCFLCCLNPVIMSFQPEDFQKPTPHGP